MSKTIWEIISIFTAAPVFAIYVSIVFSVFSPLPSNLDVISSAIIGIVFLSLIPLGYMLYSVKKRYSDLAFSIKERRNFLYIFAIANYLTAVLIFWYFNAHVMMLISLAYVTVTSLVATINLFSKISAHTAGTAGPITALVYVFGLNLTLLYLVVIPIAYARFKMKAHTIPQLIAGVGVAIVVTYLTYMFLY